MPFFNEKAYYGDETPIAAIATAHGISALSLIRISGKGSVELLSKIFSRPQALKQAAANSVVYGWMLDDICGARIDETLVSVYRAPKSFTGEDGADICCHGGLAAARSIMTALLKSGFREALPGEFSFRAFSNGKIDLSRAEAIMELVGSKTDTGRAKAVKRLAGAIETRIRSIQNELVSILAEVELNLDYSEVDGIGDESEAFLEYEKLKAVLDSLDSLSSSFAGERIYREGIKVVLAGAPNAGKSSLFNMLVQEERSIVSEIPGTTRDWLEAWISLKGIPVCLIDTAGLREDGGKIEKIGIERSRALTESAELVLFILDGATWTGSEDALLAGIDTRRLIYVWNKADIVPKAAREDFLPVSATAGTGIDALCSAIVQRIEAIFKPCEDYALGSDRQKLLVDEARNFLREALRLAGLNEALELIAGELRGAVNALGEITGEVSSDDILNVIFSKFCVGK
jgi:tRNA modification GTPase